MNLVHPAKLADGRQPERGLEQGVVALDARVVVARVTSQPVGLPRFSESNGAGLTPPSRVLNACGTPARRDRRGEQDYFVRRDASLEHAEEGRRRRGARQDQRQRWRDSRRCQRGSNIIKVMDITPTPVRG